MKLSASLAAIAAAVVPLAHASDASNMGMDNGMGTDMGMDVGMGMGMDMGTGQIGSRQHLAGGLSWGCRGGVQRSCGDNLQPIQLGFYEKPPMLKHWPIFPVRMSICGGLAPCGPSALLATKNASFELKTCHLSIPRIMGQKIRSPAGIKKGLIKKILRDTTNHLGLQQFLLQNCNL